MSIGNIWHWRHNFPNIPLCPWRHNLPNIPLCPWRLPFYKHATPLGRSLPFLMPDPGGITCLLAIFAPGGTISPKYHQSPGGHHSIKMRPYGVDLYLTTILIILFGTTIIFTTVRPSVHFLIGSSSIAAALMSSSLP